LASTAECFGMTALCSLHAGVPVMAFSAPPLDEFIEPGNNGILIPSRDLTRFETALTQLTGQPDRLARLRLTCSAGLAERAHDFEQAWGTILFEA
jgi:glycosyltransferase involved in cell wall biosynthesis